MLVLLVAAVCLVVPVAVALRPSRPRRRALPPGTGTEWAGRLALPLPESEQCRRRRAMLDATGRPDPTSLPDCGTGEGATWDPTRVGWVRRRDGQFIPFEARS